MSEDTMANHERRQFALSNQPEQQPHTALARIHSVRRALETAKTAPIISFDISTQHGLLRASEKMRDLKTALTSLMTFLDIKPGRTQYRRPEETALRREVLTEINRYIQIVHLIINALSQRYTDSLDEGERKHTNRGTFIQKKVAALLAAFSIVPTILQDTIALPENGGIVQTTEEEVSYENFSVINSATETISKYFSALEELIENLDLGTKVEALRTTIEDSNQQDTPTASAEQNPIPTSIGTPEGPTYVIVSATQNVNIRAGAGTNTTRMGSVSSGTTLQIDQSRSTVDGWIPVLFNDEPGYISEDLVRIQAATQPVTPEPNPTDVPIEPAPVPPTPSLDASPSPDLPSADSTLQSQPEIISSATVTPGQEIFIEQISTPTHVVFTSDHMVLLHPDRMNTDSYPYPIQSLEWLPSEEQTDQALILYWAENYLDLISRGSLDQNGNTYSELLGVPSNASVDQVIAALINLKNTDQTWPQIPYRVAKSGNTPGYEEGFFNPTQSVFVALPSERREVGTESGWLMQTFYYPAQDGKPVVPGISYGFQVINGQPTFFFANGVDIPTGWSSALFVAMQAAQGTFSEEGRLTEIPGDFRNWDTWLNQAVDILIPPGDDTFIRVN